MIRIKCKAYTDALRTEQWPSVLQIPPVEGQIITGRGGKSGKISTIGHAFVQGQGFHQEESALVVIELITP